MRIAALQLEVSLNKKENLNRVDQIIDKIKGCSIDMVILPEMFICPYQTNVFEKYAEYEGEDTWKALSKIASENNIYLVSGSVPERDGNHIYNTSYVFDRNGKQIAKHRKMHLFDINIPDGQNFKESEVLSVGYKPTVFNTEFGKIGLCICYDFRFPELSRIMVDQGAKIIIVPAAFNMTTGPSHWDILFRTRALDNQVYTIGVAPARNPDTGYSSWGHSLVVSPWGKILHQLNHLEDIIITDIDLELVTKVRSQLPLLSHRRFDIYTVSKPL
ncbi:MAG: carbon-nitrogen hydrolase family protein [Firmicutes bacterium]|jgi:predicted amidohydrolase|nr:carbon-nitrogen hydrolase family protein [Bacillota bacterium]